MDKETWEVIQTILLFLILVVLLIPRFSRH